MSSTQSKASVRIAVERETDGNGIDGVLNMVSELAAVKGTNSAQDVMDGEGCDGVQCIFAI